MFIGTCLFQDIRLPGLPEIWNLYQDQKAPFDENLMRRSLYLEYTYSIDKLQRKNQ